VLSIAQNIAELDRIAGARADVLSSYAQTIRDTAAQLPEIRRERVTLCQEGLGTAANLIESSREPRQWAEGATAVRNALMRFQEETTRFVQSLQSNLASTSAMLQRLMGQLGSMGSDQHEGLQDDIGKLRQVAVLNDLKLIQRTIQETTDRMSQRLEELRREQSLVVAQLQEEIQILHRQLGEKAAAGPAPAAVKPPGFGVPGPVVSELVVPGAALVPASSAPGAVEPVPAAAEPAPEPEVPNGMRRDEFAAAIKMKSDQGDAYSVSIFWLSNLAQLFTRHDPDVVIEMMNLATSRIRESLLDNPLWTRWEDDCFAICTSEAKAQAARSSQALAAQVSGDYAVSLNGQTTTISLRVVVGVVERAKEELADKTMGRINQMAKSLRSMA
jgi:hypothetical protein